LLSVYSLILLNSETTKRFLQSITFADAKRTFTKDVLMRIDLLQLAKTINKQDLKSALNKLNEMSKFSLTLDSWNIFLNKMKPINHGQIAMFT
jgi:5,10-methylene-tetrahydrofolate dehydrogenase/methenyl tetrahydrofolate cyclohydrolase